MYERVYASELALSDTKYKFVHLLILMYKTSKPRSFYFNSIIIEYEMHVRVNLWVSQYLYQLLR